MSPQYGSTRKNLTRIVIQVFNESEVALLAAKQKILNVSAFSRLIQPQVEQIAGQKVSFSTIGMIISRYLKENQTRFSFPQVFLKEVQELGSRHGYSMIKIKFEQSHPNQYYAILAKLVIYEIKIAKLSISNGVLTMLVDQEQSGLTLIALRSLLKKKCKFSSQTA
ncbi:MAG: hypothetical protein HN846_03200 [Candidatus Pacebacteria bacterium]|jgi:hypothetical protein|nr:hypothetical protein [Candidatus Paceibacterota bacterium]MBT4005081.1 hypothetical protein [Candidatus Paceibacterota bacterium]MBT4358938.1 hypothetical protein [Candidatus Paceibacterota bacterium]MBT4680807.1 hypothetical protein [Candidatus Paceibacterota bacterium]MBT6898762.1 hypothetical protein [Candidatus Paceibacterota bacterium]